jgi:hypothetical protein
MLSKGEGVKVLVLGLLGLLLASTSAFAYQPGEWVLGKYRNGPYWFPGIVQSDNGGKVTIAYDDGDRETLPSNQVKTYNWQVGSRVECNWKNGGTWYGGKITALRGGSVSIAYDDGDKENTTTGKCRSK